MALLFVAGVMTCGGGHHFRAGAAEKSASKGLWVGKAAGAMLAVWGIWMLAGFSKNR